MTIMPGRECLYCDNCAEQISEEKAHWVDRMPVDFDSGMAGESAALCEECYKTLCSPMLIAIPNGGGQPRLIGYAQIKAWVKAGASVIRVAGDRAEELTRGEWVPMLNERA